MIKPIVNVILDEIRKYTETFEFIGEKFDMTGTIKTFNKTVNQLEKQFAEMQNQINYYVEKKAFNNCETAQSHWGGAPYDQKCHDDYMLKNANQYYHNCVKKGIKKTLK